MSDGIEPVEKLVDPTEAIPPVTTGESGADADTALPQLTLDMFRTAAKEFAAELAASPLPSLYGATDGKAVGTKVEAMFKEHLQSRYDLTVGNAASGLDFPSLNLDLKVTSRKQPQSSSPFRAATQKIYGLGYSLLVIVYVKRDDASKQAAYLDIENVIYIDKSRTGDFTLSKTIRDIIANINGHAHTRDTAIDDLDALLQDKNVPLDEVSRRQLAERLIDDVPEQGVLTISNALQWRLQYTRAINTATMKTIVPEVEDLRA